MGEMSDNFPWDLWAKGLKIFQAIIYGNFQGNVRECLGIWGISWGKLTKRKCLGDSVGNYPEDHAVDVLGKMYGGDFFIWGGGICLLNISKRMRGNFLGEISQGNVWGLSGKALFGRNVA